MHDRQTDSGIEPPTALSDAWVVMDSGSGEVTLSAEWLESDALLLTVETDGGGMAVMKLDEAKARKLGDTIGSRDEEE